jgi:hypothetical protein
MGPDEPLVWPSHYPPTDRWKRFFIGVRRLGPDLSFFQDFRDRQALRSPKSLEIWPNAVSRNLALIVGEALVSNGVGWSTPWFVPNDDFAVMLHGPRFQVTDDLATESAICEIERRVGRPFTAEFWRHSAALNFGEVVRQMLEHGASA